MKQLIKSGTPGKTCFTIIDDPILSIHISRTREVLCYDPGSNKKWQVNCFNTEYKVREKQVPATEVTGAPRKQIAIVRLILVGNNDDMKMMMMMMMMMMTPCSI